MRHARQTVRILLQTGVLAAGLALVGGADAANSLDWRKSQNRVDADISGWPLPRLLEEIAAATDWQIFVEPKAKHTVSTKFKDRTPGDALRLLLGDLNFAVLPQTNGPSKLFVFQTSLQEATQQVRAPEKAAARTAKPIPNELIVTLKKGAKMDDLARLLGAKVVGRADGLNAYRLEFESAEAAAAARDTLKNHEDVASIDYNYAVSPDPSPEALSFSSVPSLNLRPKAVGDANRVIVGLIDTAVRAQGGALEGLVLPGIAVAGDAAARDGQLSHGDSMAQILLRQVAAMMESSDGTRVRILPVDVYGANANTTTFDVAAGVSQAISGGATIVNLSLGSDGDSSLLHDVIKSGYAQGVVFLAAAGNQPTGQPTYPAAYPEVIAVTAGDRTGKLASYANWGDFVDVVAPGSGIVTSEGQSYLVSGTSVSTASAAGTVAGLADTSQKKPSEVAAQLQKELTATSK